MPFAAAEHRISEPPANPCFVQFHEDFGQRFLLTVDTEEEFDWSAPLQRDGHTLHTVRALSKFQQFCEGQGVTPVYLMDYPVASSRLAADILGDAVAAGQAEIGIQLHPWVNPPFDEEINEFNSYAGNLPIEFERDKFRRLRTTIEDTFGVAPLIYRAGRYGIGPNSAAILREGGIAIDSSVRPRFDYSHSGGPDFRHHPLRPYWIGNPGGLMELPLTTVFWGPLRRLGPAIYPRMWRAPRLRGALARAGVLERIPLTPEGVTVTEAIRGIDIALDEGLPLLVFSFHSPSLAPGFTPYVRDHTDLDALYDWWRSVFADLSRRGVPSTSVREIVSSVVLA